MATQTTSFDTSSSSTPTPQPSGWSIGNLWRGTQSVIYSPVRNASEEAMQGLFNRFTEIFNSSQPELTLKTREIFTDALVRTVPEAYLVLLSHFETFLKEPQQENLEPLRSLLEGLTEERLKALSPQPNAEEVRELTTLRAALGGEISHELMQRIQRSHALLKKIVQNHEGALLQSLKVLTDTLHGSDGLLTIFKEYLIHPEQGLIAQGLTQLREQLTSRAEPALRGCKQSLENYRQAVEREASKAELLPLAQTVRAKLADLLTKRDLVPQFSPQDWTEIEALAARIGEDGELEGDSDAAYQCICKGFATQRGILEEAADILVEGLGRGVEHLVPLPGRMLRGVLSPSSAPAPAAGSPPPASTGAVPTLLNIAELTGQGQGFLNTLLSSAGGEIASQGARSLATLLKYTFEKVRDHVQRDRAHTHLLDAIEPMVQRLQLAKENSSWTELIGVLQDSLKFLSEQQVYLQGLRLPINPIRNHASAIPDFLNNISAHERALGSPSQQNTTGAITPKMIARQAEMLKARTASYWPARLIVENICGLEGSAGFYEEIFNLGSPSSHVDIDGILRERLFCKIDSAPLHLLTKWVAKAAYDLIRPLSGYFVNALIDNALQEGIDQIHAKPSYRGEREEVLIKTLRNWMAVTSGAYNQVAGTSPSQVKDFSKMLEEALKNPERNGGLTQQELYAAVGKTALDAFGPSLKWGESIDAWFKAQIPEKSPLHFLNPLVSGFNFVCRLTLKSVLFIPQWIGNQVLQRSANLLLNRTTLIKDYAEQTIESLRRNTPSAYAAQRFIFRQQQKILEILQRNLSAEAAGVSSVFVSLSKKVELASFVEYALELLNKGQYPTQDRLRNYLNHHASVRDRVGREMDDTFLPEVMETTIKTFAIALESLTGEAEMEEMLYSGLQIANDAFEKQSPVSEEDFAALEKGNRELSDQILETALFHAIGMKFDFTNERQRRGITHFMTQFKDHTVAYSAQLAQGAAAILADPHLSPDALLSQVTDMIEESTRYNKDRVDALSHADGNTNFHTETKSHFNELSTHLVHRCIPLSQHLNTMKTLSDEAQYFNTLIPPLLLMRQSQRSISALLQNNALSLEQLSLVRSHLSTHEPHLKSLQERKLLAPLLKQLQTAHAQSLSTLTTLETHKNANGIFQQIPQQFALLKQKKEANPGRPPTLEIKQLEKQLCDLIATLPFDSQRTQLNNALLTFMLAENPHQIRVGAMGFHATGLQLKAENETLFHAHTAAIRQSSATFERLIHLGAEDYIHRYAENKKQIRSHAQNVQVEAQELNGWAQEQHDLPIWNLFLFDMQWINETVQTLAFDRSRGKVEQLFDALYQKYNYIGFTSQVILLPFLEKYGGHYLKNG